MWTRENTMLQRGYTRKKWHFLVSNFLFFGLSKPGYHKPCPDQTILIRWKTCVELDDPIRLIQHVLPGKDRQWNLWKTFKSARTGVAKKRLNTLELFLLSRRMYWVSTMKTQQLWMWWTSDRWTLTYLSHEHNTLKTT